MQSSPEIDALISKLDAMSPSGHAIGLHIRYTTPTILLQTYDPEWINVYTTAGYVMSDPTVHWGFSDTGSIRWSAIDIADPNDVMGKSAAYGMKYGISVACEFDGSRSISSFARADREYTDEEIAEIEKTLIKLHHATVPSE